MNSSPCVTLGQEKTTQPVLSIEGVEKHYAGLGPIDLDIHHGEFVCLMGPSGVGKSTLLGILAGLIHPDAGRACLDGETITGPSLRRAVVFQQHVLLPWLSTQANIEFALRSTGMDKALRRQRAQAVLETVKLAHVANKYPWQLSGGMQQRVGIARALALEPEVILLDEPFSALDALTRLHLQDELRSIWQRDRRTTVMVTHDVDEALRLAERIVVLGHGEIALDVRNPTREQLLAALEYDRLD